LTYESFSAIFPSRTRMMSTPRTLPGLPGVDPVVPPPHHGTVAGDDHFLGLEGPSVRGLEEHSEERADPERNKASPDTFERVSAIIDKHRFVRNAPARALKSERSNIIALVYPFSSEPLANPHDAAFVGAVEQEVSGGEVSGDDRHPMIWAVKDVAGTADKLRSWRVDGCSSTTTASHRW
jgi:hypothetical protein